MIFNQKLIWLLLPCSLTSLSAISFSSTESSNPIQAKSEDKELSIEEELAILSKIGTSDSFLEFGAGEGPKKLEDLVKNYLKTTTGAKELAKRLTQYLIVNLIDGYSEDSATKSAINDRLKGKLMTLRSTSNLSSLGAKEQQDARFLFAGEDEEYKKDQVLKKSREIFEPVLNEVLGELTFNNQTKFKNEQEADPLKGLFAGFWDYVLDDYLNFERPIPFKKLTWDYDKSNRKGDIAKLFENPDSSLSETASYHFPFISKTSEDKFKAFLESIKQKTPSGEELKKYSDANEVDLIIPISSLVDGQHTSQFSIAILQTFRYLISPEHLMNEAIKDEFLRNSASSSDFNCDVKVESIPSAFVEKISGKTTSELFCLKKGNDNNSRRVSDFVYLIQKEQKEKETSWILFKDKDGIHALTYDSEVFTNKKYGSETLKKHLINKTNYKENLSKYLNKHFERLILGYWDKFFEQEQEQESKNRAKKLSEFLLRDSFSKHLILLRKALLKDFLDTAPLGKKNNSNSAFVGKFPYLFFEKKQYDIFVESNNLSVAKDTFTEQFITRLESDFLINPKFSSPLLSNAFIKVEEAHTDYSNTLDKLFNQSQEKSQRTNWKNYSFFKFNESVNTSSLSLKTKVKEIKNIDLLESVWKSLLQDSKLSEVLFEEKIKKSVDYFDLEKWEKNNILLGDIDSINFKDSSSSSKNNENLILNYLLSQYIDLNSDLSIPQLLGRFNFAKVGKEVNEELLKDFLQKTLKKFRSSLSSSGSEISKGGALTDLFTIKWLAQNNFENFRKYLRKNLQRASLSGFVFSKRFSEKDKCLPSTWDKDKISENLELKYVSQRSSFIFKDSKTKDEDLTCLINSDIVNFAKVTTDKGHKYLTGYRGLVNTNWKDFFPEDIVNKLEKELTLWKDNNSLIQYIGQTINSENKYEELIKKLKALFPKHNWDFNSRELCQKFNFDWKSGARNSCLSTNSLSFNEKKELLKKYIQNQVTLNRSSFISKNGWFKDEKGNYLIKSSDGTHHQIYLVQIKYDDVENSESWKKYLETIDSSYFFRELIKTAKDSKVKQQALLEGLTSGTASLKDFKTGDDRLRRALGYSWLKSIKN